MNKYIAIIHKDHNSDYSVSFPDFPGCIAAGSTLDEAETMAKEALTGHIKLMEDMCRFIPAPSSRAEVIADMDDRSAMLIEVQYV